MIIRYLRDERRVPWACIVLLDKNHIGWSMCCPRDKFTYARGRQIAINRAMKCEGANVEYWKHHWTPDGFELWQTRLLALAQEILRQIQRMEAASRGEAV